MPHPVNFPSDLRPPNQVPIPALNPQLQVIVAGLDPPRRLRLAQRLALLIQRIRSETSPTTPEEPNHEA